MSKLHSPSSTKLKNPKKDKLLHKDIKEDKEVQFAVKSAKFTQSCHKKRFGKDMESSQRTKAVKKIKNAEVRNYASKLSFFHHFPSESPFRKKYRKESYYNISNCTIEREKRRDRGRFSGLGRIGRIDRKKDITQEQTRFREGEPTQRIDIQKTEIQTASASYLLKP